MRKVGGDQIEYPGEKYTRTAGLTIAKILINSVISTKWARFEYMVINLSSIPQEIIDEFGLLEVAHDGRVYTKIQKEMYGLSQADILANKLLQ
jgi:hypothetical protein